MSEQLKAVQSLTDATEWPVYNRMPVSPKLGEGCRVTDENDDVYLDLYGGHAVALTGHCHPRVVAAIQCQASELVFYSSAVYSKIRAEANQALLAHAPVPGSKVFHCVSGSEANEVAIKAARRVTGRQAIVSFENSFHGRTHGCLSVCGMEKYKKTAARPLFPEDRTIAFGDLAALQSIDESVAAVICEGIQSLGGAVEHDNAYYQALEKRCQETGACLIFDEIQTGMGRTGQFFFAQTVGVQPHFITLAKGIASGVPAGAVIARPDVIEHIQSGDQGSTFGGGPIAMAAMKETVEVINDEDLLANVNYVSQYLRQQLATIPQVKGVRGRGFLLGLELDCEAKRVQQQLLQRKIITGLSVPKDVLRLLPPLVLKTTDVDQFIAALKDCFENSLEA